MIGDGDCGEIGGMKIGRGTEVSEKTCPSATCYRVVMYGVCFFIYFRKLKLKKRDFIGLPHVQAAYCCNINTRGSSFSLANTFCPLEMSSFIFT
jgi:hypothetical protein